MSGNPAVPADLRCPDCDGWGFNPAISEHPVDIVAPLTSPRSLAALHAYIKKRVCCPACDGYGKIPKNAG